MVVTYSGFFLMFNARIKKATSEEESDIAKDNL